VTLRLSVADLATVRALSHGSLPRTSRVRLHSNILTQGKWTEEIIDRVVEYIGENVTASLKQVIDWAEGALGAPRVSESTLASYLGGKFITYKQVVVHNQQRNSPEVKEQRKGGVRGNRSGRIWRWRQGCRAG
jgi:hypothetical protein